MPKSIRLSEKHGLNPTIPICYLCMEEKNELILAGHMKGDMEAPKNSVWDMEPCDKCKEYQKEGIILISVKDGEECDNPYRTGGWCVVTEDFVTRAITPESLAKRLIKTRVAFVPDQAWKGLGLPTEGTKVN